MAKSTKGLWHPKVISDFHVKLLRTFIIIGTPIMSIKTHKKINFIIEGEPASKANSRKIVNFGKRMGL